MKLFSIMAALTVAIVTVASTPADAKKYHRVKYKRIHHSAVQVLAHSPSLPGEFMIVMANTPFAAYKTPVRGIKKARQPVTHAFKSKRGVRVASRGKTSTHGTQIVEHPAGCPSRAFCGCGASIKVFGKNIRSLWLAANWFQFPASTPGPGKVAVRRHHVFVILENKGNGTVLAYDANSGGHKTRIHIRSLNGYSVRDPLGGNIKVASK